MDSLPLVVVSTPGPVRDRLLASLGENSPEVFDSLDGFTEREGEGWGILLLGPGLPPEEVLRALKAEVDREVPWSSLLVSEEDDGFRLHPISVSHPMGPEALVEMAAQPEEKGPVHEIHWVLRVVSRARHDLNNPLTSGLAEAQLLLMDDHPPEVRESLETIQEQFRRLRDMVAALSNLRVRKTPPPL